MDTKALNDIEATKKRLKALGERLSKTTVVCGTMNSLLEGITEKEIRLLDFEDTIKGNDIVNIGLHFFLKNVRPYAASCSEA